MLGQFNLKTSLVVWSRVAATFDFDVIVKRTKNENSDAYAPPPPVSYLSCLSLDDAKIFSATAGILRQLPEKLLNAEDVHRASQNLPVTLENGTFIIEDIIRLLEFYGQLFDLQKSARDERSRRRSGPPLQVMEVSSGSLTSSVSRPSLTMQEFEALNLTPSDPNERIEADFKVRLEHLIGALRNCNNYLRANNSDDYKTACRNALTVADTILTDSEIVADVAMPALQAPLEQDPSADVSERFRIYHERVYAGKPKGLVGVYNAELKAASKFQG